MVTPVSLVIAQIGVTIEDAERQLITELSARFGDFVCRRAYRHRLRISRLPGEMAVQEESMRFTDHDFCISHQRFQGRIDLLRDQSELVLFSQGDLADFEYFSRIVFAYLALQAGGMLLHGAGVVRDGGALVFFGPSGCGKSTIASLAAKDQVLNDDLVMLLPGGSGWDVHPTPYWNQSGMRSMVSRCAPLQGLFRLVQDHQVFLEGITRGEALAELFSSIPVVSQSPCHSAQLLAICATLLDWIPLYRLHFLPDESFWQVIPLQPNTRHDRFPHHPQI